MAYCEVLSVTWANFTIVKYNSKISVIYHQIKILKRYNEQVFNKTVVLKGFAIFTKNTWVGISFLKKMQAFSPETLSRRTFNTGFFL